MSTLASRDYPMSALGTLQPPYLCAGDEAYISEGEAVINGVALPRQVIDELRKLGVALSWYNAGELHDAIQATHYDGQLIDDHDGVNFRDKLHHTEEEKETDEDKWCRFLRMRVRNRRKKKELQSPDQPQLAHDFSDHCGIYSMF